MFKIKERIPNDRLEAITHTYKQTFSDITVFLYDEVERNKTLSEIVIDASRYVLRTILSLAFSITFIVSYPFACLLYGIVAGFRTSLERAEEEYEQST